MKYIRYLALLFISTQAFSATVVSEGSFDSVKTYGDFLDRPASCRALGMGNTYTASADDAGGVSWNPAGIGQLKRLHGVISYERSGGGSEVGNMAMNYLALALPVGPGVMGVSYLNYELGTFEYRDGYGVLVGTESLSEMVATVSYAMQSPQWIGKDGWVGLTLEGGRDAVDQTAFGINLGAIMPIKKGTKVGLALLHLGPARDGHALPATANMGAIHSLTSVIDLAADMRYSIPDGMLRISAGSELSPTKRFSFRAGLNYELEREGMGGEMNMGAGMGIHWSRWGIDWAYHTQGILEDFVNIALVIGGADRTAR